MPHGTACVTPPSWRPRCWCCSPAPASVTLHLVAESVFTNDMGQRVPCGGCRAQDAEVLDALGSLLAEHGPEDEAIRVLQQAVAVSPGEGSEKYM